MLNYDSKESIINFKAYDYFAHILELATKFDNGVGRLILNLSGLSELAEVTSHLLDPHTYNGMYQNENLHYNPKLFFLEYFPSLNDEYKFLFLKNIIEKVDVYRHITDMEKLENYLNLFGYTLIESECLTKKGYSINKSNIGLLNREEDISYLLKVIKSNHPHSFIYLEEAISNFGNTEYKSCIDNARTLLETIVYDLGGKNKSHSQNFLTISSEKLIDENKNELTSRNKIFEYWLNNNSGANRYRVFYSVYSAVSGLGTHAEEVPSKKDALMFLRIVEDILAWILI